MLQPVTSQKKNTAGSTRKRVHRDPVEQARAEREAFQHAKEHGLKSMRDLILSRMSR